MLQYKKIDALERMWALSLLAFKNVGFEFKEHVYNGCHDLLTVTYSLKNTAMLSAKWATFSYLLMGTSKNEALKKLNKSVTYDRRVL